ncbi:MAG: ABC transporter ATP-binding protein [Phycisphaerae bacterium]
MSPKVEVAGLTKRFRIYRRASERLSEWLSGGRLVRHSEFTALDDVSFVVRPGEFFGVIGPNGAGKSTLLKILTGVMTPTSGSYRIDGRVTSLLELGTGFHPELTGRENIRGSARLIGLDEAFIREREERIVAFADIAEYIDQPIKYYSSGMSVRLAFSIFAHVEPDVFIVDEALSVGDIYFSQKCFRRLDEMRQSGCTLLFCSHDLAAIRKYCDHALYLHQGRCRYLGSPIDATDLYLESMSPGGVARQLAPRRNGDGALDEARLLAAARDAAEALPPGLSAIFAPPAFERVLRFAGGRIGSGEARLAALVVRDKYGKPREHFTLADEIHVDLLAAVERDVPRATVSIQASNRMGVVVWGTNVVRLGGAATPLRAGTWSHTRFVIQPGLGPDEYTLDFGYGDAGGEGHVFDRLTAAARVHISPEGASDFMGLARIPCSAEVTEFARAQGVAAGAGR